MRVDAENDGQVSFRFDATPYLELIQDKALTEIREQAEAAIGTPVYRMSG
jgi:hypothetical protein